MENLLSISGGERGPNNLVKESRHDRLNLKVAIGCLVKAVFSI